MGEGKKATDEYVVIKRFGPQKSCKADKVGQATASLVYRFRPHICDQEFWIRVTRDGLDAATGPVRRLGDGQRDQNMCPWCEAKRKEVGWWWIGRLPVYRQAGLYACGALVDGGGEALRRTWRCRLRAFLGVG